MNLSPTQLSGYPSLISTKVTPITLKDLIKAITTSSKLQTKTDWYRMLADKSSQQSKQYKAKMIPAYSPVGMYLRASHKRKLVQSSGFVWIDFDDCEHPHEARELIAGIDGCILSYCSLSGTGVHSLFATTTKTSDPEIYGRLWDSVVRKHIPYTMQKFIDPASRRLAQLALCSYDSLAKTNTVIEPLQITLPKPKPKRPTDIAKINLPPGDRAKQKLTIYTMLDQSRPPDDYPTWIKLLTSLKSGGINEGAVNAWSQRGRNYNDKSFSRAWQSLSANGRITIGTFFWWYANERR